MDTRIIAATQKDLIKAIEDKSFRKDLFYQLSVVPVHIPPLRERGDDILLLANYYFHQFCNETKKKLKGFNQEAISMILSYQWPGNVRELENRIKRAVIMGEGPWITPQDLDFQSKGMSHERLKEAREKVEMSIIRRALDKHNGNLTKAAAEIGVSRPTLDDLIRKYDIKN